MQHRRLNKCVYGAKISDNKHRMRNGSFIFLVPIHEKEGTDKIFKLLKEGKRNRNEMKCAQRDHYTNRAYLSMDSVSVAAMKPYSADEMASALTSGILDVLGYASIYYRATVKRSLNADLVCWIWFDFHHRASVPY